MTITRALAAAAMLAGLAVGTASIAWADTTMSGHYIMTETGKGGRPIINDWNFTPCGDGCASLVSNGTPVGQARLVNDNGQLQRRRVTSTVPMAHWFPKRVPPAWCGIRTPLQAQTK
jgi:hypothetical protein